MRTYIWVPRRNTVYEVESNPIMDVLTGESPVQDFVVTLFESSDGRPHGMFMSYRELMNALAGVGKAHGDVNWKNL